VFNLAPYNQRSDRTSDDSRAILSLLHHTIRLQPIHQCHPISLSIPCKILARLAFLPPLAPLFFARPHEQVTVPLFPTPAAAPVPSQLTAPAAPQIHIVSRRIIVEAGYLC
jgi:hypothetical protein